MVVLVILFFHKVKEFLQDTEIISNWLPKHPEGKLKNNKIWVFYDSVQVCQSGEFLGEILQTLTMLRNMYQGQILHVKRSLVSLFLYNR